MKIAVCLKQVQARDAVLKINSAGTWIVSTDVSFVLNEPDIYALEEGLRLKEKHGGEVLVVSLGPARAQQGLKEALAKGADRALHLDDPAFESLDAYGAAQALAKSLAPEKPDLILTGLQSDDLGFAQTGVILAVFLGLAHSTIIMEIEVQGQSLPSTSLREAESRPERDRSLKVKRELEGGWFQWLEMPLPALLTIQSGINKPRYATLSGIMKAKTKPLKKLTAADLGLAPADLSPRQKILKVYVPVKKAQAEFFEGNPKEIAARLVDKLRNEARVL